MATLRMVFPLRRGSRIGALGTHFARPTISVTPLRAAYGNLGGLLFLVAAAACACLTANWAIGALSIAALPVWMAASYVGLSFWAIRSAIGGGFAIGDRSHQ